MIVKFFKKPSGGGSGSSSIDYLLNQKKHDGKAEVLQGDPELSRQITENLEFATAYTVGCLSFEENDLDDISKQEIMDKFENAIFAGLDKEQYNILWVQHRDKDRLELNFYIPNVELTSGKRLQPYYDKADRPLVENFKQVINHDYGLSDPNAPEKKQTLITKNRLPKDKKEALEAITRGIEAKVLAGDIKSRTDVLDALTGAGFEIARKTPKNISIKTDGQNLRLKGAVYEEDFRFSEGVREEITKRSIEHGRDNKQRYKTARATLDRVVSKREQEYRERYPSRATKHDQEIKANFQPVQLWGVASVDVNRGRLNDMDSDRIQQPTDRERISKDIQADKPRIKPQEMQTRKREKSLLHRDRSKVQESVLGQRQRNISDIARKRKPGLNHDTNRNTIAESTRRLVEKIRTGFNELNERIKNLTGRSQIRAEDVQRDTATKSANKRAINEINDTNQALSKAKQQSRNKGFSL